MDLSSILYCQRVEEALCGYRANVHAARFRNFFTQLVEAGAKLVFFNDVRAVSAKEKSDKWLKDQDSIYANQIKLIDLINKRTPVMSEEIRKCVNLLNTRITNSIQSIIANLGEYIPVFNDIEYSALLASYCTDKDAFCVFTNDTDLLMFYGYWHYFAIKQINFINMTVLKYDKNALYAALKLTPPHLPLFATLCGNDIIDYEVLAMFHKQVISRYKSPSQTYFESIAKYVKNFHSISTDLSGKNLKFLASEVFAEEYVKYVEPLQKSINSYGYLNVIMFCFIFL